MEQVQNKRLGCLGIGLIVLGLVVLLIVIGTGAAYVWGIGKLKVYTAEKAEPVPVVEASPQTYERLRSQMDEFAQANSGAPTTLILTAADLNTLVALSPEWEEARGAVNFAIVDNHIIAHGSFPLPAVPGLESRYLNGIIAFIPRISDGAVTADLLKVTFDGKPLPDEIVKNVGQALLGTLCRDLVEDPVLGPVLRRATQITVADGKITVASK